MKCFNFSRTEYNYICEEAMLSDELAKILEMEIRNYSRQQIADAIGKSIDRTDDLIAELKAKIKKVL